MSATLKPLHEQVAVVFGASSGIGRATAKQFAAAGTKVVVAARNQEGLDSLVAEITGAGGQAVAVTAEATDFAQVEAVARTAVDRFGRLDTWAHVAATAIFATFEQTSPEEFRRIIEVNLIGEAFGAKAALPHLRAAGGGALIFVGSVESVSPMPYHTAYNASKHGIKGLADTLRLELAHDDAPVSVTLIMPAGVNTPFFDHARTRLGVQGRPPRPIYQPAHVAHAILHAAAHPTRELFVGGGALMFVMGYRFLPKLMDKYLLATAFKNQRTDKPQGENAPHDLFEHQTGDARADGDFTAETKGVSLYVWLQTHPQIYRPLQALALTLGAAWLTRKALGADGDGAEPVRTARKAFQQGRSRNWLEKVWAE